MSRIGSIVLYTLSEQDVKEIIERRRQVGAVIARGNTPTVGQEYPAIVLADWGGSANLRVLLDGYDEHWATSRPEWTEDRHKLVYFAIESEDEEYQLSAAAVRTLLSRWPDGLPEDVTYEGDPVRVERVPTHEFTWRERPAAE